MITNNLLHNSRLLKYNDKTGKLNRPFWDSGRSAVRYHAEVIKRNQLAIANKINRTIAVLDKSIGMLEVTGK